jgi:hypothetical protein
MTDGYNEACAVQLLEEIKYKFWKAKTIFELEEDFDLLFKFYENMKYYQNEWLELGLDIPLPKHIKNNE